MLEKTRIGIPMIGNADWHGGVTYIELLLKCLRRLPTSYRPQLVLVIPFWNLPAAELNRSNIQLADEVLCWGVSQAEVDTVIGQGTQVVASEAQIFEHIDFFYPAPSRVIPKQCAASWIPDFQHRYLPQFFSAAECAERDRTFGQIAAEAEVVVFSSDTVLQDFRHFYPESTALTFVLRFFNLFNPEEFGIDPRQIQQRYGLPDRYLIVCNQFWTHKDHRSLIRAFTALRARGSSLHLVCTGATVDYRAPEYFTTLRDEIRAAGVESSIHILGLIPRSDQIQLIRRACAVVQPSLFEGWSTVVEDARALGKTIFLSALDVHREQAPCHGIFFPPGNAEALAAAVAAHEGVLSPGPEPERERLARDESSWRAQLFARDFCVLALSSMLHFRKAQSVEATLTPPRQDDSALARIAFDTALTCCRRGEEKVEQGDIDEAIFLFELAANQQAGIARPLNNLGAVNWQLDRHDTALEFFQAGVAVQPDDWNVAANLVAALLKLEQRDEARTTLLAYLTEHPDHPEALAQLLQLD